MIARKSRVKMSSLGGLSGLRLGFDDSNPYTTVRDRLSVTRVPSGDRCIKLFSASVHCVVSFGVHKSLLSV